MTATAREWADQVETLLQSRNCTKHYLVVTTAQHCPKCRMEIIADALTKHTAAALEEAAKIVEHLAMPADLEQPCGHLAEADLRKILAKNIRHFDPARGGR